MTCSVGHVSSVSVSSMTPSPPISSDRLTKVSLSGRVAALNTAQISQFASISRERRSLWFANGLPLIRWFPLRTKGSISFNAIAALLKRLELYFIALPDPDVAASKSSDVAGSKSSDNAAGAHFQRSTADTSACSRWVDAEAIPRLDLQEFCGDKLLVAVKHPLGFRLRRFPFFLQHSSKLNRF